MGLIFNLFKKKEDVFIIKTVEQKIKEKALEDRKKICPNCGKNPDVGPTSTMFGSTDGEYNYKTCGWCDTDYKYKR